MGLHGIFTVKPVKNLIMLEKDNYAKILRGFAFQVIQLYIFFFIVPKLLFPLFMMLPLNNLLQTQLCLKFLVNVPMHLGTILVMNQVYKAKIPFFEQFRISKDPWPWEVDPVSYKKLYVRAVKTNIINSTLGLVIQLILIATGRRNRSVDPDKFPSGTELIVYFFLFTIISDAAFYWIHRFLHLPMIYKHIHKWHHEYTVPEVIATLNTHPLEFVISNVLPFTLGPALLGSKCHLFLSSYFGTWNFFTVVMNHSGYEFPWIPSFSILPFTIKTKEHDYHHRNNLENYAAYYSFWDTICGTNKSFLKTQTSKLE